MASKRYAKIDRERCAACGACTKVCPKGAVRVHKGCYAAVDPTLCVGCQKCAGICPAGCIEMRERQEK